MKIIVFAFLLTALTLNSFANHTKGGWMYYKYLGPGTTSNSARYLITLKIYTECILNANQWCPSVNISIFETGNSKLVAKLDVPNSTVLDIQNCTRQECHECVNDIPSICYKIATFEFTRELPVIKEGYTIAYQRCCRIANIINLAPGSSTIGDTWAVSIPGSDNQDPLAYQNSSAIFAQNDTAMLCNGNSFEFDFSAVDPDGDSLAYSFADAYYASRGNGVQCNAGTEAPDAPPYVSVSYTLPYSGSQPLGPGVVINSKTGIVSGIAPQTQGTFVLTCVVREYKRGTNIVKSSVRKSLHIFVASCSMTEAILDSQYVSCDGFTMTFSNKSLGGNIRTYNWDFGVPGISSDTSDSPYPSFTFPDTGVYVIKMVVNRNLPCSDSAISVVKVYPVFLPGFFVQGQCRNTPISFFDTTFTTYGRVNSWQWNFGDLNSDSNESTLQTPQHVFATGSSYPVTLTVSNTMGCMGSVRRNVLVTDKPALKLTNDTLICTIDTLQLGAEGLGTIAWSPGAAVSDPASFSPLVSPDQPTTYYATLTDPYGCIGTDSVFVDVKNFVSISAGKDTLICATDPIILPVSGDALIYRWSSDPSPSGISDPTLKNPLAIPLVTTVYRVKGNIGKCFAADEITISVVPYPQLTGIADTAICFGTSASLHARGGAYYSWSPPAYLNDPAIADPISVKPLSSISYTVTVKDTLGCPKPVSGSLIVNVLSVTANAGPPDTTIVRDQPLVLNATGGSIYQWSPGNGLNDARISNPVATPLTDIKYTVKVSNEAGCVAYDSIYVKLYNVAPGIYVPTAFTPNSDGRNDYFRPIALGLKTMDIFRIYNRWGQLLYSDTNLESPGWDGTYKGNKQEPATYVWYAEGYDYRNEKVQRKGYFVLIR